MWKNRLWGILLSAMLGVAPSASAVEFPNPIQAKSFPDLIVAITKALVAIGIPLAVLALVFAGFRFLTGAVSGNQEALTQARKMFWWILIGTAIVVGARVIAGAVVKTFETL